MRLVNIGFNNAVVEERIVAIVSADASPARRLREAAVKAGRLVDGTNGRKTRSVIVTDSNHIVLSSVEPQTLSARVRPGTDALGREKA